MENQSSAFAKFATTYDREWKHWSARMDGAARAAYGPTCESGQVEIGSVKNPEIKSAYFARCSFISNGRCSE
jgi:hypothetical protein